MERLTRRYVDGQAWVSMDHVAASMEYECVGPAIDRLAAYEDTGIDPKELNDYKTLCELYAQSGLDAKFVQACIELMKDGVTIDFIDHLRELVEAEQDGRLVVLHKDYSDKDGKEALRRAMWECGYTNNAVTRYTADAIAEKLTHEEAEAALEAQKGGRADGR